MARATSLVRLDVESNQYERKLKQAQRSWNEFTRGIGLSVAKFTAVGVAVAGVTGAMKVMKDAFSSSERKVDEFGRTMEASKSLYQGFLNALNTGDISGYLGRIDDIVSAARRAYDELDRLGTMKTIQAPATSSLQAEITRMRSMLQTKTYIESSDPRYNTPGMKTGDRLSDTYMRYLESQIKESTKKLVDLVSNEVKQTTAAIDAEYANISNSVGLTLSEFRKGTSSMAEFDKRIEGAELYEKYKQEHSFVDRETGELVSYGVNPYEAYKGWADFRVDGEQFNKLVALIQQKDQQMSQMYSMQGQVYRTINRVEGVTSRIGGDSGSGGGSGAGAAEAIAPFSAASLEGRGLAFPAGQMNMQGLVQLPAILSPLQQMEEQAKRFREEMEKAATPELYAKWADALAAVEGEMEKFKDGGKVVKDSWQNALGSVSQLGSALTSLEDPAAKVFGTIAQAIANVALGFSNALKTPKDPWTWLAFAAAGTATMISTISAIKSATAGTYANGGIIPGNSFSGDNQWAQVNAGELILNRAQQGALASQISERERQSGGGSPYVTGDKIFLGINNYLRHSGRGQLVTTRG